MTSLEISLPEPLRRYVEQQARAANLSPGDYVRLLIEERQAEEMRFDPALLTAYLEACERQIARGEISTKTAEEIIAEGHERYRHRNRP